MNAALSLNLAHKHRDSVLDWIYISDVENIPRDVFDEAMTDDYTTFKKDTLPRMLEKKDFKAWNTKSLKKLAKTQGTA